MFSVTYLFHVVVFNTHMPHMCIFSSPPEQLFAISHIYSDLMLFFLSHRSYSHCMTVLVKPWQAVSFCSASVGKASHLNCFSSLIISLYHCGQKYHKCVQRGKLRRPIMNYSLFSTLFILLQWNIRSCVCERDQLMLTANDVKVCMLMCKDPH